MMEHYEQIDTNSTALRVAEQQRQETAELVQLVFNSSMVGISVLTSIRDEQGEITDFEYRLANRVTEETNNRTDLVGKRYSVVHPAYRQAGIFDDFVTVVQTGSPVERERHYAGEGFDNWYATVVTKLSDGVVLSFRDITREVKARQQLEASEARFRSLVEEAPVATCLFVGRDMTIEVANDTMIGYWGKDRSVIGKPLNDAVPELEGQPFLHLLDDVFTTGRTHTSTSDRAELEVDGVLGTYYFDYTYKPLRNAVGEVYAIMNMAIDVTEQVIAQQQIEAERLRFRTLLETIPPMTWTNTIGGYVNFYNQRWYDYTGLTVEQSRGRGWQPVVHPNDLPRTLADFRHALATGEAFTVENRYRRADGEYRWHLNRALPLRDETGQITLWVGTATDIHEQKQQESNLEHQVQARTQQLQASIRDLERSNRNLEQFAYIASHDLQEPLRKIRSFGDLLQNQYAAQLGEGVDHLNRMQLAAGRMSTLIKDLLTYSRISTRQETTNSVSLNEVVQTVLTDLELVIGETGAVVEVEPLPTIPGDESQLGQLFQNLLNNALKFRRRGLTPVIRISARRVLAPNLPPFAKPTRAAAAYHCLDVADNGIGFEQKYTDRIFQVFQRLHGKNQFAGTGIGLAICEKVAANHGGAITATSEPGQGATFSVYLPV